MKHTCYIAFVIMLPATMLFAGEAKVIRITADTPWVVAANQPEPLRRALNDVKRDWYKVLGSVPIVLDAPPASAKGPVIYLGLGGEELKTLVKRPFSGRESFVLRVGMDSAGRRGIVATGADVRGAIYAAYALSQEILGVDPWWYWTDHEPERREHIDVPANLDEHAGPPTFKWRGWFINDEDLLSAFAPDPLGENVISPEMFDHICETLLRLRGNMIVPGTFMFPDERNNELCARRGLAINFHHIEALYLNTWRWPKNVPFSFHQHPEIMEAYWQTCVDAVKDKEVVWTVGYRGKHDRPFWADEKGLNTAAQRGAAISRAIARQVDMVRKVQPNASIITNLWMEGAGLYHDGFIKLPAGVTVVWPDDGSGMIRDQGRVKAGQGIYYHTAMLNGNANQLSEMVPPARIYHELGRFVRAGGTEFFLVNVSDIRPVPLSTDCAMRMAWNAKPHLARTDRQNQQAFYLDWCRREYGADIAADAARLYAMYFDIPYHRDSYRAGDNAIHRRVRMLADKAAPLIAGSRPLDDKALKMAQESLAFVDRNKPFVADLAKQAQALAGRIPQARRQFFKGHLLTQARIHLRSLEMAEGCAQAVKAYAANDKPAAIAAAQRALQAADALTDVLHAGEYGKWAGWYRGEGLAGETQNRDSVRALLAALRGEPAPLRHHRRGYGDIYRYQEKFLKNFPLLYPRTGQAKSRDKPAR